MQTNVTSCPFFDMSDDLICDVVPACRVLLMSSTCKRMREVLQKGRCGVEVILNKHIGSDVPATLLVPNGINRIQKHFKIQRFEYYGRVRIVSVKFDQFEEVSFMHLTTLKMHCCQLKEVHLIYLTHLLTFSKNMRTFEFTYQGLKCRHTEWLAECIRCFSKLETLNLNLNYFVFDSLGIVLDAVQTSSLSTLNLSTNSCEDETKMTKLCRVIHTNCMTIKTLNLSFMRLFNDCFDLLVHALSTCPFLESLDLSKNHLHYGRLMDVLKATEESKMQSFNWSGNRLGLSGRFFLTNHLLSNAVWKTTIREIKLATCDLLDEVERLCEALSACTRLQTLDIANNGLYASDVAEILKNPSITSLDVSNNYISDYGMQLIFDRSNKNKTLRHLNVQGNHMTLHTLQHFRRMRKSKKMTILLPHTSCVCAVCQSIGT